MSETRLPWEPTPEIVAALADVGVDWIEDAGGAPHPFWRNTDALNMDREIGGLAQAVINYAATRDERELQVMVRLACAAIGNPAYGPSYHPCVAHPPPRAQPKENQMICGVQSGSFGTCPNPLPCPEHSAKDAALSLLQMARQELERLPASDQQTKVAVMLADLNVLLRARR